MDKKIDCKTGKNKGWNKKKLIVLCVRDFIFELLWNLYFIFNEEWYDNLISIFYYENNTEDRFRNN